MDNRIIDPQPLAEAITTLAENPRLRAEMGVNGHDYVKKHFNRPDQAEKFAQVIEKLVIRNKV